MFKPKKDYSYETVQTPLEDFHHYKERFILRPPYQRKANIWSPEKRRSLLDSICKGFYIPPLVLREVRFADDRVRYEVIDGQQRITAIQLFYQNKFKLPKTLETLPKGNLLIERTYDGQSDGLDVDQKQWFDKLYLESDIIKNIDSPSNAEHLKKAADIFWRLQLGEPLTFMERQHARVYSGVRNFVTKFADDTSYDYKNYQLLNGNSNRHNFFGKVIAMKNNRMQHLLLLSRFLMLELANGPTDLGVEKVEAFFAEYPIIDVADISFEKKNEAKLCLKMLNKFFDVFKNDLLVTTNNKVIEFKREYFIISFYMLLRHLETNYVFGEVEQKIFHEFLTEFYQRWTKDDADDTDILRFRENRQHSKENVETRDLIIRGTFFDKHPNLILKDNRRNFDEAQRIAVFRRDKGLCQVCKAMGKSDVEAAVSWSDYNADHIIAHIKGGRTLPENAQVLCKFHNLQKGGR